MPENACQIDVNRTRSFSGRYYQDAGTIEALREGSYIPQDLFVDEDGFPLGWLSSRTVVYTCGAMTCEGSAIEHNHPTGEIALCQEISSQAASLMEGVEVGMGSEGGDFFRPFFIAANEGAQVPKIFSELFIRKAMGGVIYPKCPIWVEPLEQRGQWWFEVCRDVNDYSPDQREAMLPPWKKMITWFQNENRLHGLAFIRIGDEPIHGGACFPRIAAGITNAGSIVGIWGDTVHT